MSTGRLLSSRGSQAGCLLWLQKAALPRGRCQESTSLPQCCRGREEGHCGRGSTARVWRDLPLELVLQVHLVIPLPPAIAGDLPQDARHHLPQGPVCPWGKAPATARTKSL